MHLLFGSEKWNVMKKKLSKECCLLSEQSLTKNIIICIIIYAEFAKHSNHNKSSNVE